eukprot:TRINITY_DN1728_c0_g1_i1.p1 TRINITY_DN1728_c0_g1~~TRINITY_DN1728_c0_g1_i1.p1  ORF type:complete len:133 (-),score=30.55 TRINITY_DN1728_c0_g1_i1:174-572(-)
MLRFFREMVTEYKSMKNDIKSFRAQANEMKDMIRDLKTKQAEEIQKSKNVENSMLDMINKSRKQLDSLREMTDTIGDQHEQMKKFSPEDFNKTLEELETLKNLDLKKLQAELEKKNHQFGKKSEFTRPSRRT